ncbi:NUDIX hydrolase [Paenibacillus harenae]|uniref:ADP-ribose pyrophosphatase YjhB (NUDIX family) n=1 Tax=Paenibacillus harenae TaxID=306543 RepID=A0ABT9U375_PAEHA|nr:NUDIX hydrolase [Paenibacillus harenae]MDQ0114095.1 ADP-ribose pyrophosphatase YjhB (NUDIX family) [Paenibacillus harenae]
MILFGGSNGVSDIVSAGGIVEDGNGNGNILLVKAHDDGWVNPGGITEVGENLIDGVIREIKEESGIDATFSHLICIVSNTAIHKWYDGITDVPTKVMFDFVCKAVGGELLLLMKRANAGGFQRKMFWSCLLYLQSACVMKLI